MLYLHQALGYKNAVVGTPDADIFVILLYQAHAIKLTVYLDTWSGKHRQLINLSDLAVSLGETYCATLLGVEVFNGEDCTSAKKGKGKVGPLKKQEKNPRYHKAFMKDEQGWIRTGDGLLEPVWHCGPVLPNSLISWTLVIVKRKTKRSLNLKTILVVAIVNDILTIIMLTSMRG